MMSSSEPSGTRDRGPLRRFLRWVFGIGLERNLGGGDRTARYGTGIASAILAVGVVLLRPFGFPYDLILAGLLVLGGLYLIYEARVNYCPTNHAIGRNTYRGG